MVHAETLPTANVAPSRMRALYRERRTSHHQIRDSPEATRPRTTSIGFAPASVTRRTGETRPRTSKLPELAPTDSASHQPASASHPTSSGLAPVDVSPRTN